MPNLKNEIIIKDNFFSNPIKIRKCALNLKYKEPKKSIFSYDNEKKFIDGWRGFRCEIDFNSNNEYIKIPNLISEFYSFKTQYKIDLFFHYSLENTKKTCFPSFEKFKYHKDGECISGVVYLHPDPPKNTGTTIFSHEKIDVENHFNRLVCYHGNMLHGPSDLFGKDIYTGRLTLTFFLYFL